MSDDIQNNVGAYRLDEKVLNVLGAYHQRIDEERGAPRQEAPGGRDGGQDQRMRAVGPETGRFLNILVRSLTAPTILELGTSFGYSGIWLAEAARATGGRLITMIGFLSCLRFLQLSADAGAEVSHHRRFQKS